MTDEERQYRQQVREARSRIAAASDQAILKLSSGGLALSFAFVSQFVGGELETALARGALTVAWICWASSSVSLIVSYWLGMLGTRRALKTKLRGRSPWNAWIELLNFGGGALYVIGLCNFVFFMYQNAWR